MRDPLSQKLITSDIILTRATWLTEPERRMRRTARG